MFSGTPRPLPPAKARRVSAALQKLSSTPPPAYGSPFTFPSRNLTVNLHGQDHEYDADELDLDLDGDSNPSIDPGHLPSPDDGEEWMSEKSREELRDMLLRADGIIKERENELGIASAVAKGLYQSNVVLKSRHQELLSRLPLSPVPSNSSPELPYVAAFGSHSRTSSTSMISSSTSDSALGLIKSPRPTSLYALRQDRAPTRKVAIATADISLLADQNAELLDKLEKLEAEATSADHAGRRELKRLEKEITFLREALEKTQAKSEELEEKVQDAVVGEVWRRKKEREAKFRAMRGLGRERVRKEEGEEVEGGALGIRNFAPTGSRFGGPSDKFSFFPSREESPEPLPVRADVVDSSSNPAPAAPLQPDQNALISQLLVKVKELEETNNRILQQQSETATQLSAVQRDTAHITKVYETLADQDNIELALDEDGPEDDMQERERERLAASTNASTSAASLRKPRSTMRFMSLKRNIENELAFDDQARPGAGVGTEADGLDVNVDGASTFVVHPDFISSVPKNRKSVMGLFDNVGPAHAREIEDQMRQRQRDDGNAGNGALLPSSVSSSSSSAWSEGAGYVNSNSLSFWSSSSAAAAAAEDRSRSDAINANANGSASGTLSPLHFFSPALPQRRLPPLLAGRQGTGTGINTGKGTNQGAVDSRSASSSPDFNYLDLASPSPSPSPFAALSALPIPSGRPTLQAELSKSVNGRERGADLPTPTTSTFNDYGNNDYNNAFNHHFRTSSLYDLSQISVPPTPSPMSRDGLTDANANSLMLSVEPPTPHKLKLEQKYKRGDAPAPVPVYAYGHGHARRDSEVLYAPPSSSLADAVKSPRIKLISDTLKSRTNRWVERRLNKSRSRSKSKSKSKSRSRERADEDDLELELELELEENRRRPTVAPAPAIRGRLSNAVDNLIEGFNGFSSKALGRVRSSRSRSGSASRERAGERQMLAIDTAVGGVEMTEGCSPAPLSSSLPSSASSEEGEGGHLRQRQRHQRQGSAPLLIYTDSPRPSSSNSTSKNKDLTTTAATTAAKSSQSVDNPNPSLLLQVWMWFQFAVVVLVFVYAMAKRGPRSVLVGGEDVGAGAKRAVARRRG